MAALEPIKDNDEAVKAYGIQLATDMSRKILATGIRAIHLYTLNMEKSALAILMVASLVISSYICVFVFQHSQLHIFDEAWIGRILGCSRSLKFRDPCLGDVQQMFSVQKKVSVLFSGMHCLFYLFSYSGHPSFSLYNLYDNLYGRANRPKSYISRTIGWNQYPSGRWGDCQNPTFGELTDYQACIISCILWFSFMDTS